MKNLKLIIFIFSLGVGSSLTLHATPQQPDSTISTLLPDSLRVTIDPGEFKWRRLRYEAELRVSAIYPPESAAARADSLTIFINMDTPGTTFWVKTGEGDEEYVRSDYLTLYKDEIQAKGKLRWRISGYAQVTVKACNLRNTKRTEANFPVMLILVCIFGGVLGGWLRRSRDPGSVVKLPVRLFSQKWSRRLEPIRELFFSMVAGVFLYLLNLVSPVYLEFRTGLSEGWLVLVQPLLIGFIGGWSGINLLVNLLNQSFRSPKTGKAG